MRRHLALGLAMSVALSLLVGCGVLPRRVNSYFHLIPYPDDVDAMEGDWEYLMQVDVIWPAGVHGAAESDKDVRVRIFDSEDRLLFENRYHFTGVRSVESTGTWREPDHVSLEIREDGYSGRDPDVENDAYNAELVASGGRTLARFTYRRDEATGRFVEAP